MNSKQESKLNMYNAVIAYCNESDGITVAIPAFAPAFAAFTNIANAIDSTAQLEAQVITGITINKADLKKVLCTSAEGLAAAVYAYASVEGDPVLQEKSNYSVSDFLRLKDDELTIISQNLHDAAAGIVADLLTYGVTAATLEAFQELIDEYSDSVTAPRNAVALRKTYVAQLKILFKETDKILKTQLDKLALQFKTSQPEFYATYKNNRRIISAPTSATQAKGVITDTLSGLPLYGVLVTVDDQEYNTTSNLEGAYSLKISLPGIYTMNFIKEGYQGWQAVNVEILLGQATTIEVQLTPVLEPVPA